MKAWRARLGQATPERTLRAALLVILFCLPLSVVLILGESRAEVAGRYNQFAVPTLYLLEAVIAASAIGWVRLRRPSLRSLRPYRWLIPAPVVAALSMLWAPSPLLAGVTAIHLALALALLVMLAAEFRSGPFLRTAAWTLTAAAGLQALVGIGQFLSSHDLGLGMIGEPALSVAQRNVAKVGDHLRAYGTLPHPNVLAAYLAVAIFWVGTVVFWPFRSGACSWPTRLRDIAIGSLLALLGIGLLLTFSRTALAIVAVNGALVVLFSYRRWRRLPLGAGLAALTVAIAAGLLIGQLVNRTQLESSRETGITNRTVGYELAGQMLLERPYGVGAGNFVLAAPEFRNLPAYQYQPAHNATLLAAAEVGILPMLLLVVFVVRVGIRFHFYEPRDRRENTLNFSLFAVAGVLIALGMTDHFLWSLPQGLWITVVVLAAVIARIPARRFGSV